jgi:hypothetical protein
MDQSRRLVQDLSISKLVFMHQIMTNIEKLQKMTTIIHKERTLYTTICFKKDMLINLQEVEAPKLQP